MLTIETLNTYGADTQEGLTRCLGNEGLYLRLVGMIRDEKHFDLLETALEEGNLAAGFEAAHALKGVLSNLSLTPLQTPVEEITERLRAGETEGTRELMEEIRAQKEALFELI